MVSHLGGFTLFAQACLSKLKVNTGTSYIFSNYYPYVGKENRSLISLQTEDLDFFVQNSQNSHNGSLDFQYLKVSEALRNDSDGS